MEVRIRMDENCCEKGINCDCGIKVGEIQIISDLNEIDSPVFNLKKSTIKILLFQAGIIKSAFKEMEITIGYVEKKRPCPECKVENVDRIDFHNKSFDVFSIKTPGGMADILCEVYLAS